MTKQTGIFFPYFHGERLRDFPGALEGILDRDNVSYYDARYDDASGLHHVKPAQVGLLAEVHSRDMIERVRATGDFEGARYSAGGTVQAAGEMLEGRIDNAFVFTSFGDHHAGRDFFGGMCYFNGAALAIALLREKGMRKFAIVDTDSHHADGTRDIFARDSDMLHVCFCSQDYHDGCSNVDVAIPYRTDDETYLRRVREEFVPRAEAFQPEVIFWEYGYDATQGEYGDRGLTPDCHVEIARTVKKVADGVCGGRLVVILCGGSSRRVATYTIPRIIRCLAEAEDRS